MNVIIVAKVIFVSGISTNQKLKVYENEDNIVIEHELYGPNGEVREFFFKELPKTYFKEGTMHALVRFWNGWIITDYQAGMTDAVFGVNHINQACVLVGTSKGLVVFPNIPVENGPNVSFITGGSSFWASLKAIDSSFEQEENKQRSKYAVGMALNSHSSIAALENQVDLLTRVLMNIVEPGKSSLLDSYRVADQIVSTLSIKSEEDIISNILTTKSKIRDLQLARQSIIKDGATLDGFIPTEQAPVLMKVGRIDGSI